MNKGDLISRSNFEKNILQAFDSKLNEHDAELMVEFLDYLDDEPTAYNVDKVVEEIRRNSFNSGYKPPITKISTNKAVELIKAGGVNE